ncbi:MAG: serine/threonine-protein kinase, partial [Bryobacteraceae bacterium]
MHCSFCGAALEALTTACLNCGAQPVLGDRYEVRALVGRGGMGEVFLAYDRKLDYEVALKRLPAQFASSPELRESLTKEARTMARLSDSGIVRLFDLAEFHGDVYIILEYVCGPTLREMLRGGYRASPLDLAHLLDGICRGLTAAHHAGVIHRDLKPSNLLIALEGAERAAFLTGKRLPASLRTANVKITDFGIAKAIAVSGTTMTNAFSGTPGYMAPEQFRGELPSPETDVYALGIVTCELLTGKLPSGPPAMLDGVHPAVTQVIATAMSPYRQQRFPSASAYYEALCNAIEGRVPQRAPLKPAALPTRRIAAAIAIVFAIFVCIAILAIFLPTKTVKNRQIIVNTPFDNSAIQIDWHSPPRVTELPPIVEEARGRLPEKGLVGPLNPKEKWSASLRMTGAHIAAIGIDGTVYLTAMEGICAVRNGKLLWAYKSGMTGASDVQIDENGLIWYHSLDAKFCINRDGKGGRVPREMEAPPSHYSNYGCRMNNTAGGPHWSVELDGSCTPAGVTPAPDGRAYIATDLPEILAVNS